MSLRVSMYQLVNSSAPTESKSAPSCTVQSSNEPSPASFFAILLDAASTCLDYHLDMTLMLGVIAYLYVFVRKDQCGRGRHRAGQLQLGGVCLFLTALVAFGVEAALLLMGTFFMFVWRSRTRKPMKEKIVPAPRAHTSQSPSAARLRESTVTNHEHGTLEAQARDIVRGLTPLRCDESAATKIALLVKRCVNHVIPEAVVHAIPLGNAAVLTARGARPEVDVVVTVPPDILAERLRKYYALRRSRKHRDSLDTPSVLHKAATRTVSEMLTFARFWRSQLTSPECKVVVLVPRSVQICHYDLYCNLYVNAQYPLRVQSLLSEACLRRKKLVLVVTHWAAQRCITNVQRGQLAKYAWAALVWYFCTAQPQEYKEAHNIIDSFHRFVSFYADWFHRDDQPSVSFSRTVQIPPGKWLLHLPYIEDHLAQGSDVAEHLTVDGFTRVKAELQRAKKILSRTGGQVAEDLFEKWTPEA